MKSILKSKLNKVNMMSVNNLNRICLCTSICTSKRKKEFNKGFTLVELIVVLVLMTIILGIGFFGILGWQDWARFKHEEASAEEIFFAAQNQLVELDGSGALERKIIKVLKEASAGSSSVDSATGYATSYILSESLLEQVIYETNGTSQSKYVWDDIWKLNMNPEAERGTMIRLRTKTGDYNKYIDGSLLDGIDLSGGTSLTEEQLQKVGAKVLFDLIASYVSDTSVLNHAIVLEFSPDAGLVFSASYTDRADELLYDLESPEEGNSSVSIMDRSIEVRSKNMVGYYSVDQLAQKIRGRGDKNANVMLELNNSNVLDLVLYDTATDPNETLVKGDTVVYKICSDDGTELMKLTMDIGDMYALESSNVTDVDSAAKHPTEVVVEYLSSKYMNMNKDVQITTSDGKTKNLSGVIYRFPMYKTDKEYHMIFDAADVQAQTLSYYETLEAMNDSVESNDNDLFFRNTYSFYRFGIDERAIFAQAEIFKEGVSAGVATSGRNMGSYIETEDENGNQICESPTFKKYSIDKADSGSFIFDISNCRHLYNVRYETDYKNSYTASDVDSRNTYRLLNDLDWEDFIGTNRTDGVNYFLNSFDGNVSEERTVSGIDYDGLSVATGDVQSINEADGGKTVLYTFRTSYQTDTTAYPFPGFRCLSKNDTFTSASTDAGDSTNQSVYTISNLHITVAGNILYGIYGREIKDSCIKNNQDDYSEVLGLSNVDSIDSAGSKAARAGLMPLGLFAENLGNIKSVALNKHVVEGLQRVDVPSGKGSSYRDYTVVYSCMVGGFAGNNIGTVSDLTLFDNVENNATSAKADVTHINGRTDVGGIIGRQSFTTDSSRDYEAILSGLYNYGNVTGMENIGGIVGRAYVHYVGDDSKYGEDQFTGNNQGDIADEKGKYRYEFFHDGYRISDKTINGVIIEPSDTENYRNAKSYSMTGQVVYRDAKITISYCYNYGIISGDELVYNYIVDDDKHLYHTDKNVQPSYTQNRSQNTAPKTYRNTNDYKHRCTFIGGIAGIFQDGLMIEDNNSVYDNVGTVRRLYDLYDSLGYFSGDFQLASMKNCSSVMLYQKASIDSIVGTIDKTQKSSAEYGALKHDYYKGGLVGYARLFSVEDCDSIYDYTKGIFGYSNPEAGILGFRYIGGIFGCSDCVRYDVSEKSENTEESQESDGTETDLTDKEYSVVNNATVIGRLYVGGVAGGIGAGDEWQETLSFRDSSLNEGSTPSQLHYYWEANKSAPGAIFNTNMLNTGTVLAIAGDKFKEGLIENGDQGSLNTTGAMGGVVGATAVNILNCDNIQSEIAKRRTLELIGFAEEDIDNILNDPVSLTPDMIIDVIQKSKFGGCSVGGTVGHIRKDNVCGVNTKANNSLEEAPGSVIDAIVYGSDYVGGSVGYTNTSNVNNIKPVKAYDSSCGMVVIGQDIVGGLLGYSIRKDNNGLNQEQAALDWEKYTITDSYVVVGKYEVGGIVGLDKGYKYYAKLQVKPEKPVVVKAKSYAGAYIGIAAGNNIRIAGNVSGIKVSADYFAGAYAGAYQYFKSDDQIFAEMLGRSELNRLTTSDIQVIAKMFAGGAFGLVNAGHDNQFNNINGNLYKVADVLASTSTTNEAYSTFTAPNINGTATGNRKLQTYANDSNVDTNPELVFRMNFKDSNRTEDTNYILSGIYVESELFAGGLFGYVPEGLKIEVSNFTNSCSVCTTGYVGGDSGTSVTENYDDSIKCSYLGGITGRVPTTMTLTNCKNKATGTKDSNEVVAESGGEAAPIYESANASYMGGLTEVNAGTIKESINNTPYMYEHESIAAFAGVNGVVRTDAEGGSAYPGTISACTNEATINGVNVAGMAVYNCGTISDSINKGAIAGSNSAGILVYNDNIVNGCTNNSTVSGVVSGGISTYAGNGSTIKKSYNNGSIAVTDSVADAADASAGGILGKSDGEVSEFWVASCVNTGLIKVNGAYNADGAAGIAYDTSGAGIINACRNYAPGLKNGITATDAKTIVYCLNTGRSENRIGSVVESDEENMYANFYTGNKGEELVKAVSPDLTFRAYQAYAGFDGNYSNEKPVKGNTVNSYIDSDYKLYDMDIISELVMSKEEFESDLEHETAAKWYLYKYDGDSALSNTRLAFRISPLTSDGRRAYADIDNIGICWDNYQITESNKFNIYWSKKDGEYKKECEDFYDDKYITEDISSEDISFSKIAEEHYNASGQWWSFFFGTVSYIDSDGTEYEKEWNWIRLRYDSYMYSRFGGDNKRFMAFAYNTYYDLRNNSDPPSQTAFLDALYQNADKMSDRQCRAYSETRPNDYKDEFENNLIKMSIRDMGFQEYSSGANSSTYGVDSVSYIYDKVTEYGYDVDEFLFNAYCYMIYYSDEYRDDLSDDELKALYIKTIYEILGDESLMKHVYSPDEIQYYIVVRDREDDVMISNLQTVSIEGLSHRSVTYDLQALMNDTNVEKDSSGAPVFNIDEISNIDIVLHYTSDLSKAIGVRAFTWDTDLTDPNNKYVALPTEDTADTVEDSGENLFEEASNLDDVLDIITGKHVNQDYFIPEDYMDSDSVAKYYLTLEGIDAEISGITSNPLGQDYLINDMKDNPDYIESSYRYKMYLDIDEKYMNMISSYVTNPENAGLIQIIE